MKTQYKSILLRLETTPRQSKAIDANIDAVSRMVEMSQTDFQNMLAKKFRAEGFDTSSRLLDLVAQRIARTVMKSKVVPLDDRNYKIVKGDDGWYYADIMLKSTKQHSRSDARFQIPVYVNRGNKYYMPIEDGFDESAILFRRGGSWFILAQIEFEKRYDEQRDTVYVGIDLNQRKHAAAFNRNGVYEENIFFDLQPIDEKCKELQQKMTDIQKGRRMYQLTDDEKQRMDKLYETRTKIIKKGHGDFATQLTDLADRYWQKGYNVVFRLENLNGITKRVRKSYAPFNRWLHQQWCYDMFYDVLVCKKYPVEQVDPRNTSKMCHKCGDEVTIYGKHSRLIKCDTCGYDDFNRDLNAARNISQDGVDK